MYTEGSNSSLILLSPQLTLSSCSESSLHFLSFWYFVYGVTSHTTLRMYIGREQVYARPEWSRRQPPGGVWTRGLLTLGCGMPLQLVFVAELGHLFTGVAIDDISILPGRSDWSKCYIDFQCVFTVTLTCYCLVHVIKFQFIFRNNAKFPFSPVRNFAFMWQIQR